MLLFESIIIIIIRMVYRLYRKIHTKKNQNNRFWLKVNHKQIRKIENYDYTNIMISGESIP